MDTIREPSGVRGEGIWALLFRFAPLYHCHISFANVEHHQLPGISFAFRIT